MTTVPSITPLPEPPLKTDPANFAERADTFLGALPDFQDEQNEAIDAMNTLGDEIEVSEASASTSASTATAASSASLANANAALYTPANEPYDPPDIVIGSDGNSYRCLVASLSGDNPVGSVSGSWLQITFSAAAAYLITADFTAVINGTYYVDTSAGSITATLPLSPPSGSSVYFLDYDGSFGTNALTIDRNAENIMGVAEDMTVEDDNAPVALRYVDATVGWRLF